MRTFKTELVLICVTARRVFGFDLNSQSVIWEEDLKSQDLLRGSGTIASNGKFYLLADENFGSLLNQVQYLIEYDPATGDRKDIVKYSRDEEGNKGISPPVEFGLDIIIYNFRPNAEEPPQDVIQMLVAYDMDMKKEKWRVPVTDNYASNGLHPPVIYDNRIVITGGDWSMYGFDVETGEQLWRTPLPGYGKGGQFWTTTNHLIHEDKLFINPLSEEVLCLNPETGNLLWNNKKGGANCTDNMVYYEKEDWLVFTSWGYGSVMVLDALTGETIHREHRFDDSSYNNDVVYDEETDMFFTSTYKHAIGFKINKPE